jgi:hypothetical protein
MRKGMVFSNMLTGLPKWIVLDNSLTKKEYRPARAFVVCNERVPRVHEDIRILPWRDFLKKLWNGEVIS